MRLKFFVLFCFISSSFLCTIDYASKFCYGGTYCATTFSLIIKGNVQGSYLHFSTACAVGTYGLECRETCGNCRDVSQCLNTNGTCLADCKDGYQGDLCKTRE